jgi:hypothetical protein
MGFWDDFREAFRGGYRNALRNDSSATAGFFAAPVRWIRTHIGSEHFTIAIILLFFGVFGYRISVTLAWLALGLGLLLFTWHARIAPLLRILFYLMVFIPVFAWF